MKSLFNLFKNKKPDWPVLPQPDDSLTFFETIKSLSEQYWLDIAIDKTIYGFQVQRGSKWRKGLSNTEIENFEKAMGFTFPIVLKNYYTTMNGLTKPGINIYGSSNTPPTYNPIFYSYPDDLELINKMIDWIYEENNITQEKIKQENISRIFPVTGHRFMLIDVPNNPILSIQGNDIIYWSDNLSKLLANDTIGNIWNISDFESPPQNRTDIKFWLD